MRVLHVITELDLLMGGPPQALRALAQAQAEIGTDVTVLPCRITHGPQALDAGIRGRLHVLEAVTDSSLKWVSPSLKRAMMTASNGCDILHVHGTWRYHSRIAPHVARATGAQLVIRPYGNLGIATRAHKGRIKGLYWNLFEKRVFNAASGIHCASEKEEREIRTLGLESRTFVVPNSIDDSLLDLAPDDDGLRAACPAMEKFDRTVIYMGRIVFIKNLAALIEAFKQVAVDAPDWHLVIAGNHEDVALAGQLKRMATEYGIEDRVSLPGMLVGGVKVAALRRADLFVQPSLHENFGVSAAEALLFGLPCVAAEGVALSTDIEAADAGLRCEASVESIAESMRQLMLDGEARKRMASNASQLAGQFRPESVARALDEEYRRCLNDSGGRA